jgi:hypothetical protein
MALLAGARLAAFLATGALAAGAALAPFAAARPLADLAVGAGAAAFLGRPTPSSGH